MSTDNENLSRRQFLKGALITGSTVAAGTILASCQPAPAPAEEAAPEEATEEAAAVTVRVLSLPWPQTPVEQEYANNKFTPETGITVALEGPPYEFAESKMRELAASQSPEFDIWEYDSQWLGAMALAGAMQNLDTADYFGSPDATIAFEDFMEGDRDYLGRFPVNDKKALRGDVEEYQDLPIFGVHWTIGTNTLGYRVDLFEEAGIVDENGKAKPPASWDDFKDACLKLTRPDEGFYAVAWYNTRLADGISMQWLPFHFSYGADLWDFDTFQIEGIINTDEAVDALTEFVKYVQEYRAVDPASANWFIVELVNAVTQDLAAMWYTYVSFAAFTEDPETSKTAGKWDFAEIPGYKMPDGSVRNVPIYAHQGIGINYHSTKKAEAWKYIQWLKSYDTEKTMVDDPRAGYGSGRIDLKDYQFSIDTPMYHSKAVQWTMTPKSRDFPIWPEYKELLDIQQREVNLCYVGAQEPRETLDKIALLQQAVMDTSPYNPKNSGKTPKEYVMDLYEELYAE